MRYKYLRTGQGPVLLLQHGFLSSAAYWHKQIPHLAQNFDVIAPTLPGFAGNSEHTAIDSIGGFSDHLLRLLDEAKVRRFHLLGHSMGGMIAQETALAAGDRVDKLVLYGTGPNGAMPGRFESIITSRQRVIDEGPASTLQRTVSSWFLREAQAADYAESLELANRASLEAILGGYTAMQQWSVEKRLNEIKNKTLILWGETDRTYTREQVELLNSGIAQAKLEVIDQASHNVHLERPSLFNECVMQFLHS